MILLLTKLMAKSNKAIRVLMHLNFSNQCNILHFAKFISSLQYLSIHQDPRTKCSITWASPQCVSVCDSSVNWFRCCCQVCFTIQIVLFHLTSIPLCHSSNGQDLITTAVPISSFASSQPNSKEMDAVHSLQAMMNSGESITIDQEDLLEEVLKKAGIDAEQQQQYLAALNGNSQKNQWTRRLNL